MTRTASPEAILQLKGISKRYGNIIAVENVEFDVALGEVRALMGKNGAGKSTIVKIVGGAIQPDSGMIMLGGQARSFAAPADATKAGIASVHQELTIIPGLSVAENITLGHWPATKGFLRLSEANDLARDTLALLGETIHPATLAGNLSIAKQQIVEIAHALSLRPKVLVLDEPTSSLPAEEVDALLSLVGRLRDQNIAVIYVSHRMDEISRIADSVTVLRDGQHIATLPISEAPIQRTAELMVGSDISVGKREPLNIPESSFSIELNDLSAGPRVQSISLKVKKGEIVGLAGLLGAGRTELLKTIAGMAPERATGTIVVNGKSISSSKLSIRKMLEKKIALVPEDRKSEGLVISHSIKHNLSMSALRYLSRLGIINFPAEYKMAAASQDKLSIKIGDLNHAVSSLSGGNQQKVVIGRCLNADVDILLLDEPTRGIDVHAKEQIYSLIRELAAQGTTIIFVSSEYEELLHLSHRIAFMHAGRLHGTAKASDLSMEQLMQHLLSPAINSTSQKTSSSYKNPSDKPENQCGAP